MPAVVDWPRRCGACHHEFYRNPVPVAVVVIPVGLRVLVVRRGIPPRQGHLALPGGFVNWGESWQEAACREVLEETGLVLQPEELRLLDAVSVPEGNLLLFSQAHRRAPGDLNLDFRNAETAELKLLSQAEELAFPTHTQILKAYFGSSSSP